MTDLETVLEKLFSDDFSTYTLDYPCMSNEKLNIPLDERNLAEMLYSKMRNIDFNYSRIQDVDFDITDLLYEPREYLLSDRAAKIIIDNFDKLFMKPMTLKEVRAFWKT